jgi:hypothetical protein
LEQSEHWEDEGLHTGVAAGQSLAVMQPTQMFEALHTGVDPEQSALVRQVTHSFATVSHMGAAVLVQSELTAHITHEPAFIPVVTQALPPGLFVQSLLDWQGPHMWVVVSHVGVSPLQSELNSQPTQVPVG